MARKEAAKRLRRHALGTALLTAALPLSSCGGGDGVGDGPPPELPDALSSFYERLLVDATAFEEVDGGWTEDYGDAPFYGLALYVRLGAERSNAAFAARAERARAYDIEVVRQANADRDWYLANMEEAMMAVLGLIENAAQTGDDADLPDIDAFVDGTDALVSLFGDYLPNGADVGSFALETYGPTSITGAAALLSLQYATYLDTPRRDDRIARAGRLVRAIDRNAWDGTRYLFGPGEERLFLYPNSMMILVQCRLFELTGDRAHLARAVATADAIAPLMDTGHGGYHSPYSAEYMGATTQDYSTLSSQNYLAMAFALLYANTHDRRWFDEAVGVLEFVHTRLYDASQHRLLHHFMDGRIAQPEDLEYFCSGCNLQFLYVLWFFQTQVLAG